MISPYARHGYVDHQTLSFDAYVKFIEDDFLGGQRLDPKNDGRPDPRPTVRENAPILGDLARDFDFNQAPRPSVILPVHPRTTLRPTIPLTPLRTAAQPRDRAAIVSWDAPLSDGGSPVIRYVVTPYSNGVAEPPLPMSAGKRTRTVSGLVNGMSYTFTVRAVNRLGTGPPSQATLQ